ncbi:hypothetical protein L083_4467 [Actinoplanes sp. N902-109]|nr:hypothetical protein L083_4467 [Actinoplanes sp. N902-109]
MSWAPPPRTRRQLVAALLVLLVPAAGGVVTVVVGYALTRSEQRYAAQAMDRYTADVSAAVTTEVARYGDTLTDMARAVAAESALTRTDFEEITEGIDADRLPGVSGIAFVAEVPTARTAATQRLWRARGATGLTLTPEGVKAHDPGLVEPDPALVRERAISVGQRVWRLTVHPTASLANRADERIRTIALDACLAVTVALAGDARPLGRVVRGDLHRPGRLRTGQRPARAQRRGRPAARGGRAAQRVPARRRHDRPVRRRRVHRSDRAAG